MIQKQDSHIFTGLQKDLDFSKVDSNYLVDALNIRMTAIDNSTQMSLTNEKGPKPLTSISFGKYILDAWIPDDTITNFEGIYIGSCVLNNYYVLFTHIKDKVLNTDDSIIQQGEDCIYRIQISDDTLKVTRLYKGDLNFSLEHPLEILTSYENETIQKVYWTDNYNQPRIINISPDKDYKIAKYIDSSFDFVPELQLNESIDIERLTGTNGSFAPGVIQYAFTYYNLYGQETNIFYTSPLYYISHKDRGASPEEKSIGNSFKIVVSNLDDHFDYLRIYSIQRTSLNGTPICRRVLDVPVSDAVSGKKTVLVFNFNEQYTESAVVYNVASSVLNTLQNWQSIKDVQVDSINDAYTNIVFGKEEGNLIINGYKYYASFTGTDITGYIVQTSDNINCKIFKPTEGSNLLMMRGNTPMYPNYSNRFNVGDTVTLSLNSKSTISLNKGITKLYMKRWNDDIQQYVTEATPFLESYQTGTFTINHLLDRIIGMRTRTVSATDTVPFESLYDNLVIGNTYNLIKYSYGFTSGLIYKQDTTYTYRTLNFATGQNLFFLEKKDGSAFDGTESITISMKLINKTAYTLRNVAYLEMKYVDEDGNLQSFPVRNIGTSGCNIGAIVAAIDSMSYTFSILQAPQNIELKPTKLAFVLKRTSDSEWKTDTQFKSISNAPDIQKYVSGSYVDISDNDACLEIQNISIPFVNETSTYQVFEASVNDFSYDTSIANDDTAIDDTDKYRIIQEDLDSKVFTLYLVSNLRTAVQIRELVASYYNSSDNGYNIYNSYIEDDVRYIMDKQVYRETATLDVTTKEVLEEGTASNSIQVYDTGTIGDTIASTDLLFKGGEEITAETLCQKDGTIFLGNIKVSKKLPTFTQSTIKQAFSSVTTAKREVSLDVSAYDYRFSNQLAANTSCFKNNEYYRLGLQFQYKNGKWSSPVYITDYKVGSDTVSPSFSREYNESLKKFYIKLGLLCIQDSPTSSSTAIRSSIFKTLYKLGYRKVRPVYAQKSPNDRRIAFQGIPCRTISHNNSYWSSWFFRMSRKDIETADLDGDIQFPDYTQIQNLSVADTKYDSTTGSSVSPYPSSKLFTNPNGKPYLIKHTEVDGDFTDRFNLDYTTQTLHSPDLEFSDNLYNLDYSSSYLTMVGGQVGIGTNYYLDAEMESGGLSEDAQFLKQSGASSNSAGLISGFFYEDRIQDDLNSDKELALVDIFDKSTVKYLIHPWHSSTSLNNDIDRSITKNSTAQRSALLKEKKLSNLRIFDTQYLKPSSYKDIPLSSSIPSQIFSSQTVSVLKLGSSLYQGNIDTSELPTNYMGKYFVQGTNYHLYRTLYDTEDSTIYHGLVDFYSTTNWDYRDTSFAKWVMKDSEVGDYLSGLCEYRNPVRIKYKSTPHMIVVTNESSTTDTLSTIGRSEYNLDTDIYNNSYAIANGLLPIVDLVYNDSISITGTNTFMGGDSDSVLQGHTWLPAGDAVKIVETTSESGTYYGLEEGKTLTWQYGDCWYQRYDCLKTYPYTFDDINQVTEIGSFMVETYINIDGRYDRNRDLVNNTTVSPANFNLINMVYSQPDNYFSYSILPDDYYDLCEFPNQIAYSTEKTSGADVDPWCSVTLASVYNLDGSKGYITELATWNDDIYCFQNRGISKILFNSRAQIATSDGVPIEISNNYKVEGKRYISDGVGCSNKYSIKVTSSGVYFIDSMSKDLYIIGAEGLANIAINKGMSTYFNTLDDNKWLATLENTNENVADGYSLKVFHDSSNQDVYITTAYECLNYSEKIAQFTSFFSYQHIPDMFNIGSDFYCIKQYSDIPVIYKMFSGEYNQFFHSSSSISDSTKLFRSYNISFISNGKDSNLNQLVKVFSNLEFRADIWTDYDLSLSTDDEGYSNKPFDFIRVSNEYQDTGKTSLSFLRDKYSNLKQKYRVWRIDVPRDYKHHRDRIRNPWAKIKLGINNSSTIRNTDYFNLHDLNVIYYV